MLKKDNFERTDEARIAFEVLKITLIDMLVLALPKFEKPFMIYTNASSDRI